jgi:hypothetical protein
VEVWFDQAGLAGGHRAEQGDPVQDLAGDVAGLTRKTPVIGSASAA